MKQMQINKTKHRELPHNLWTIYNCELLNVKNYVGVTIFYHLV